MGDNGWDFVGEWWGFLGGMVEIGGKPPIKAPKNPGFSPENWRSACPSRMNRGSLLESRKTKASSKEEELKLIRFIV